MNRHYLCIGHLTLEQYTNLNSEKTHFVAGIGREALKLAGMGKQVHLVSRLGRDLLGDYALAILRQAQVNTTFIQRSFNCTSNQTDHRSAGCDLTVGDILAAQALFIDAEAIIIDNHLAPEVIRTALELATKYSVEIRYADAAEPEMLPNYLGRTPSLELSLN